MLMIVQPVLYCKQQHTHQIMRHKVM